MDRRVTIAWAENGYTIGTGFMGDKVSHVAKSISEATDIAADIMGQWPGDDRHTPKTGGVMAVPPDRIRDDDVSEMLARMTAARTAMEGDADQEPAQTAGDAAVAQSCKTEAGIYEPEETTTDQGEPNGNTETQD